MEERITSMIPRYGKLNKIYTEIMSGGSFSFEKQQLISDFTESTETRSPLKPHLSVSCLKWTPRTSPYC